MRILIYVLFSLIKIILIIIRACPLASLGVGVRLQVRGRATWGRKAAKRASAGRFFAAASPALPALAGFPPPASRRREMASHAISLQSIARLLSRRRSYFIDIRGFSTNLFYYHVTPSGFSNFGLDLLLQSYPPLRGLHSTLNSFIRCFIRVTWLREALRWKARKGGRRWGRGGKKASL